MATTVQTVYDRFKVEFGDAGGIYTKDTMVLQWVNQGIRDLIRRTEYGRQDTKVDIFQEGVPEYTPTESSEDAPIYKVHSLLILDTATDVKEITFAELITKYHGNLDVNLRGTPKFYWVDIDDNANYYLRLWPVPDKQLQIVISFQLIPVDLTQMSDDVETFIPKAWIDDIQLWCSIKAHEREKDWQAAREIREQYDMLIARRFDEVHGLTDEFPVIQSDPYDETNTPNGWIVDW